MEQNNQMGGGQPQGQQPSSEVDFKMSRMSKGSMAILVGAIVAIVAMFLPWYGSTGTEVFGQIVGRYSLNGFHSAGYLVFLAALAALVIAVLPAFKKEVPKMGSLSVPKLQLILGGVVVVFSLITVLWMGASSVTFFGVGVGLKFGGFVALVGGVIMLVGAWMDHKAVKGTKGEMPKSGEGMGGGAGGTDASGGMQA